MSIFLQPKTKELGRFAGANIAHIISEARARLELGSCSLTMLTFIRYTALQGHVDAAPPTGFAGTFSMQLSKRITAERINMR